MNNELLYTNMVVEAVVLNAFKQSSSHKYCSCNGCGIETIVPNPKKRKTTDAFCAQELILWNRKACFTEPK